MSWATRAEFLELGWPNARSTVTFGLVGSQLKSEERLLEAVALSTESWSGGSLILKEPRIHSSPAMNVKWNKTKKEGRDEEVDGRRLQDNGGRVENMGSCALPAAFCPQHTFSSLTDVCDQSTIDLVCSVNN